ncbi:hypothetical protein C1Y63_07585 [Corynebacterium sp. 13CS0277]|uniref:hypothetical protein n=1 Tax=Corynebacterium sp. 13CS0277 TaxID=2071994 RepID=UPI000D0251AC|nr:hypothetical protein [Corynebacterium sp. 13CS0277]PRQ11233.1 hypothetical protein C1Y63_07585 [Corynebacterium sp. 13CS0277]
MPSPNRLRLTPARDRAVTRVVAVLAACGTLVSLAACADEQTSAPVTASSTATPTTSEAPPAPLLPTGTTTLLPGHRIVALYGHPSGPALGALGEQPPSEAVGRVQQIAEYYQPFSDLPVVPAFEIIATVAAADPGADGNYVNETDPADLVESVDAITAAGGIAILDIQPGRDSLLNLAQQYTDLLLRPGVGLAIDPEWALGPEDLPGDNVGHVDAEQINEVADWLAQLTRDNNLPQKLLVLHQFQLQMIRNRENLNLEHPELATVIHVDGHGPREDKMLTWDTMRQELDPRIFVAWKNFYDEDQPMFTPEETMAVAPQPVFVSYQ